VPMPVIVVMFVSVIGHLKTRRETTQTIRQRNKLQPGNQHQQQQ